MSVELTRVGTAIDLLDAAGHEEGITPDTYLGAWAVAQRDLVQALYALEQTREVQLQVSGLTIPAGAKIERMSGGVGDKEATLTHLTASGQQLTLPPYSVSVIGW